MVATGSPANMTVPVVTGTVEHAARGRRQDFAFRDLLLDHRALGRARLQRIGGDVKSGLRRIEGGLRGRAVRKQFLRPVEIGLGFGKLGLQAGDLRIERLHLQRELFVGDGRHHLILLDVIAPLHRELHHGAADPRTRRLDIGALDGGEDGLLVGDRLRRDGESLLSERVLGEQHERGSRDDSGTHRSLPLVMRNFAMAVRVTRIAGAVIDLPQVRRRAGNAALRRALGTQPRPARSRLDKGCARVRTPAGCRSNTRWSARRAER